jgi:hypothetical protein
MPDLHRIREQIAGLEPFTRDAALAIIDAAIAEKAMLSAMRQAPMQFAGNPAVLSTLTDRVTESMPTDEAKGE